MPRRRAAVAPLRRRLIAAAAALGALAIGAPGPARACDLALVLAVDVSSSVDSHEYALQRGGHARAFRDPEVVETILRIGGASVMLVHWSGSHHQERVTPWRRLDTETAIAAFADELSIAPRRFDIFSTALGDLLASLDNAWTEDTDDCARRVVDVSGDGVSNAGGPVGPARARLIEDGVTINGLVIVTDELVEAEPYPFYRDEVIGGPGAFLVRANRFEDYARAFKEKLLQELRGPIVSAAPAEPRLAEAKGAVAPR